MRSQGAFTLLELLLVISIIAVLAALAWPNTTAMTKSNTLSAATRQLADDLSFARQKAMSIHSTVYVVFLPPWVGKPTQVNDTRLTAQQRIEATNLIAGQCASYALYASRSVGDQPGQPHGRYLTEWKTLPDGVFIATNKFQYFNNYDPTLDSTVRALRSDTTAFPYPNSLAPTFTNFPYVAFNSRGQLISEMDCLDKDVCIPLARGSILVNRGANGKPVPSTLATASILETPPGNSVSDYNRIRVTWSTGRTRIERLEIK
jgi:prepilin-type N-terminal cleavage/methylation domain-containing protein